MALLGNDEDGGGSGNTKCFILTNQFNIDGLLTTGSAEKYWSLNILRHFVKPQKDTHRSV